MKNKTKKYRGMHKKSSHYFALLIITIVGIIIYSNSLDCSFHFDDYDHIIKNDAIQDINDIDSWWNYSKYRPLSMFSFVVNYHFHKLNVYYYHLVNIGIHIFNGFLVYFFVYLLLSVPVTKSYKISNSKEKIAIIISLFFLVHPLATQSVTYIIQRQAAMAAMFYLLSLCIYIYFRISKKRVFIKLIGYFIAAISFLIAILSKENAFTLPIILVLIELFLFRKNCCRKILKNYKTYLLLIVIIVLGAFAFYYFGTTILNPIEPGESHGSPVLITPWNYLLTQFSVIVKYIQLLIIPVNQNLDYDYQIAQSFFELRTFLSFILLSAIIVFASFMYKRNRLVSFGIFWFFITLSIESSFIPLADVIFEHRTYLPSIGFFTALVVGLYYLLYNKNRKLFFIVMITPLVIYSYLTYQRNFIYKTSIILWNDVVQKSPNKARAYANRGLAYDRAKQLDMAFLDYSKAIELDSTFSIAYLNRGFIYAHNKQYDKAIEDFAATIDINANFKVAIWNRGVVYSNTNRWSLAILDYNRVLEIDPTFVDAYYNRGVAFANLGKWNMALSDFYRTVELKPDYPNGIFNCAVANYELKNLQSAIYYYTEAIKLSQNIISSYYGRAVVFMDRKNWQEAYNDLIWIYQNDPNYPNVQESLDYVIFNMNENQK